METTDFKVDDFDVLAIDWDYDYVVVRNQLWLIHDVASEEGIGEAQWHLPDEYDFSLAALGIEDPRDLHELVIATMRNRGRELPLVPGFVECIAEINQAAEQAGKGVVHNVLTSRSRRQAEVTNAHINDLLPGIFNNVNLTGHVDPVPPEFPKWHHHARTAEDLVALGLKVAKMVVDDSPSTADSCVNIAGSNLGVVFGDYHWNRGKLPVVQPGPGAELRRIARAKDHPALARLTIGTFFRQAA